jgi:hypothetical protein
MEWLIGGVAVVVAAFAVASAFLCEGWWERDQDDD